MDFRTRDRRSRNTFWIDDRIVDQYGPVMSAYPFGAAALAVYIVLARRADREGDCWPRLELIASEACTSARTVQRAIRLLEVLGLIDVALCYEQGSNRQTSNLYTLLTPPDPLPEIDPDPGKWPPPHRRTLLVRAGRRSESVAAGRDRQDPLEGRGQDATRPVSAGPRAVSVPAETDTPRQLVVPPTPGCHSPHVSLTPQEGNTSKDTTLKEGLLAQKDGERRDGKLARDPTSPSGRLAVFRHRGGRSEQPAGLGGDAR